MPTNRQPGGISDIERLLCAPAAAGSIDDLLPRAADAWTVRFPGLDSFGDRPESDRPLRVCIATEEIVGPIRNGGIGTTYAALAEMLAKSGHDVTVLYLRGHEVEVETIDHWIAHYAHKGVRFVPVRDYAEADQFRTAADRWLRAPYNMLRHLLDHPMDVVHVSEWRGSAYLSLMAKRQGIAFSDTLFVVKTSSPWMWNRLYGSHALDRADDLMKITAERQSVELADIVIGGSLHLLRWMASQGYAIPRDRTFVQPNVATFASLEPLMASRTAPHGQRMPIDEIVFFGRLESRKGLFIFCQAIKRLIRMGVALPPKISFMGKPGAKMLSHPDLPTPDYIRSVTADWPVEIQILTEFQQYEAIEYLLGARRLAVMPSIIENSSMAIYEAAICGIPCVATDVGGNAELIHPDDRAEVLCVPHPVSLADKIAEAIRMGGMVARPSFDNAANLETWRRFHRQLAGPLREELLRDSAPASRAPGQQHRISVCIYATGDDEALEATLASLARQDQAPSEVLVAVDGDSNGALDRANRILQAHGHAAPAVEAFDLDAGAAFNRLAAAASGDYLLFLWEGATLEAAALSALSGIAASSSADVLTYFHRVSQGPGGNDTGSALRAIVIGSASDSFCRSDIHELPLLVRREAFEELDGFTTDYRVLGHDHEFVAKAQLAGKRCETALLELGKVRGRSSEWLGKLGYDLSASSFRLIRPELAAAPLGMRDVLLLSRGMQARGPGGATRRSGDDAARKTESLLARMMAGIGTDRPAPAAPPVRKAPAARSGMLQLLDRYESDTPLVTAPPPVASGPSVSAALAALLERGRIAVEGPVVGQFLGLHDGQLHGWAIDVTAPDRKLEIEVDIEGQSARVVADRAFTKIAAIPAEARSHGFSVPIGTSLVRAQAPRFSLKIADTALQLTQGMLANPSGSLADHRIEGFCDAGDGGILQGWAWYPAEPDRHVDVALYVDGSFFAHLCADRHRDDLQDAGIGDGDHGFRIMLHRSMREQGSHRIDALVADLGIALSRSPMRSEGSRIEVAAPPKKRRFWR